MGHENQTVKAKVKFKPQSGKIPSAIGSVPGRSQGGSPQCSGRDTGRVPMLIEPAIPPRAVLLNKSLGVSDRQFTLSNISFLLFILLVYVHFACMYVCALHVC